MRQVFHSHVYSDLSKIMEYYETVASPKLADEFHREFRSQGSCAA
jgi:hypothetical protein